MDFVLTSGRYVGLPDEEEDFNFEERLKEEAELNKAILENLVKIEINHGEKE